MEKTMRLELNMIGETVEDFKKSMELQIGDALQLKDGRFAKVVDSGVWEYDEELEEEIHKNVKFIEIISEEEYNKILNNSKLSSFTSWLRLFHVRSQPLCCAVKVISTYTSVHELLPIWLGPVIRYCVPKFALILVNSLMEDQPHLMI